jgi:hypothetical protein
VTIRSRQAFDTRAKAGPPNGPVAADPPGHVFIPWRKRRSSDRRSKRRKKSNKAALAAMICIRWRSACSCIAKFRIWYPIWYPRTR